MSFWPVGFPAWAIQRWLRKSSLVSIPVMAKVRIGHFVEAQILEAIEIDYIDESEVLSQLMTVSMWTRSFQVPFVCGAKDLGETNPSSWRSFYDSHKGEPVREISSSRSPYAYDESEFAAFKSTRRWTLCGYKDCKFLLGGQPSTNMENYQLSTSQLEVLQHQQMLRWWYNWGRGRLCRFRYFQVRVLLNRQVLLLDKQTNYQILKLKQISEDWGSHGLVSMSQIQILMAERNEWKSGLALQSAFASMQKC